MGGIGTREPGDTTWRPRLKLAGRDLAVGLTGAAIALGGCALFQDEGRNEAPRIVEVPAAAVVRLPTKSDSRLLLAEDPGLVPGDFVTTTPDLDSAHSHAREGFLLRVEEAGTADGVTTAITQPASLFEAVPEGRIVVDGSAGFQPLPGAEPASGAFALARFAADEEAKRAGWFRDWLSKSFKCEGKSEEIELRPTLDTKLKPELRLDWKRTGRLAVHLNEAAAWVTGNLKAGIRLRTEGSHECRLAPKPLWSPSWTFIVPVHGVPVPVTFKIPVRVEAKAAARAKARAGASATVKAKAGVIYERGREKPVRTDKGVALEGPTFSSVLEAKANAEAALVPGVEIVAGWSVPYLGKLAIIGDTKLRGGVSVEHDATRSRSRICLKAAATSALYWQAPFMKKPRRLGKELSLYEGERCKPPKPKSEGKE